MLNDFQARKNDKRVQKMKKGPKKSINRSLADHYHHCELRIDQKAKNTPFLKRLILGALVDETNFRSDQVIINQPLLQFNTFFLFILVFFWGGHTLKKVWPCVYAGCLRIARGQKKTFPCAYATVLNIARVHPQTLGKF
jgi:hypothetical protein